MSATFERIVTVENTHEPLPMHFSNWKCDQKWKETPLIGDEIWFNDIGGGLASRQFYELKRNGEVIDRFLVSGS